MTARVYNGAEPVDSANTQHVGEPATRPVEMLGGLVKEVAIPAKQKPDCYNVNGDLRIQQCFPVCGLGEGFSGTGTRR